MNHIEKLGIKTKRFLRKLMRNLHEKTLHLRNDRDRIMAGVILNIWGGEYHMAYQISDDCISCGVCASNCPVSAISEGDGKVVIDADTCIDCGACAENCPVGAPSQA